MSLNMPLDQSPSYAILESQVLASIEQGIPCILIPTDSPEDTYDPVAVPIRIETEDQIPPSIQEAARLVGEDITRVSIDPLYDGPSLTKLQSLKQSNGIELWKRLSLPYIAEKSIGEGGVCYIEITKPNTLKPIYVELGIVDLGNLTEAVDLFLKDVEDLNDVRVLEFPLDTTITLDQYLKATQEDSKIIDIPASELICLKNDGSIDGIFEENPPEFLRRLPTNIPRERVKAVVEPLVNAAEHPGVIKAAEEYLRNVGYSEEDLSKLRNDEERTRSYNAGLFYRLTGSNPSMQVINNPYRLRGAVNNTSPNNRDKAYIAYLKSLPDVVDDDIKHVVKKLMRLGGDVEIEARDTLKRIDPKAKY